MIQDTDHAVTELVKSAVDSLNRGDAYSLAFALRRAAEIGQLAEGTALGTAIQSLEAVPYTIAARARALLEEEAADSANALANYALARLWSLGLFGLQKDEVKAFECLRRSSDLGLPEASFYLGIYAYEGVGCSPNLAVATVAFRDAAQAGYLFAKRQLVALDPNVGPVVRWMRMTAISWDAFKLAIHDPADYRLFLLNSKAELWRK